MFAIPEREGEADLVLSDKISRNYGLYQGAVPPMIAKAFRP